MIKQFTVKNVTKKMARLLWNHWKNRNIKVQIHQFEMRSLENKLRKSFKLIAKTNRKLFRGNSNQYIYPCPFCNLYLFLFLITFIFNTKGCDMHLICKRLYYSQVFASGPWIVIQSNLSPQDPNVGELGVQVLFPLRLSEIRIILTKTKYCKFSFLIC